jgi:hypothetical protein
MWNLRSGCGILRSECAAALRRAALPLRAPGHSNCSVYRHVRSLTRLARTVELLTAIHDSARDALTIMITEDQTAVIDFVAASSTHGGATVERIDAHASVVFLAATGAYKLKRAVRFDYLDFSTRGTVYPSFARPPNGAPFRHPPRC